jgi:hypothetical protein
MDIALKGFQRKKFVRIYRKTGCFPGLVERGVVFVAKPPKCYKGAARRLLGVQYKKAWSPTIGVV